MANSQQMSRRTLLTWAGAAGALGVASPLLTACGSSAKTPAASTAAKKVTTGTVRWQIQTQYKPSIDKVLAGLAKDPTLKLNVKETAVDANSLPANYLTVAIKNKQMDLGDGKSGKFGFLDPLLQAKVIQPLDAYYDLYGWDKVLSGATVKHTTRDGHHWMVPLYVELPGISYRPSVLQKFGLDKPPQNWDDFTTLLRDIKQSGKIPLTVGNRGFSFIMLLQNMFWSSIDPASINNVIFGDAKWTDGQVEASAAAVQTLWNDGLIDPDALSIDIGAASQRFLTGKAAMNVTGTWFFATMQQTFGGTDWDLFTPPSPTAGPVWSLGEDESMIIPANSEAPDAAAALLNYLVQGDGATIYVEAGNVMATSVGADKAIPQVQALPTKPTDTPATYLYGWLPANSNAAWQNGIADILTKKKTPKEYAAAIQKGWDTDVAQGLVPENRASLI